MSIRGTFILLAPSRLRVKNASRGVAGLLAEASGEGGGCLGHALPPALRTVIWANLDAVGRGR